MDAFINGNELVFLMFFERGLVGRQHYKSSIIEGFHKTCSELRWSLIVCGVVDMLEDKGYALPYIDPATAPAHLLFRGGTAVQIQKKHVDALMKKPGDTEVMMWHLRDLLGKGNSP